MAGTGKTDIAMAMFGNIILRLITVGFGITMAFVAVGIFIGFGFYTEMLNSASPLDNWEDEFLTLIAVGTGFVSTIWLAAYGIGIIAMVIALAEMLRWRGVVSYLIIGGAIGALLSFDRAGNIGEAQISQGSLLVALSAGFVGGFIYWLIAGRKAGQWLGASISGPSKS